MNFNNMYQWDNTILDGVTLPDTRLDVNILKSQIMIDCGLLVPMFDEPQTMKDAIAQWFTSHAWNITRICNLIEIEYAPLENYDRMYADKNTSELAHGHLVHTDDDLTHGHIESLNHGLQRQMKHGLKITTDQDDTTTNTVSPYDASTFVNDSKSTGTSDITQSNSGTDTTSDSGTDETVNSGTDQRDITESHSGSDITSYDARGRAHGNIGVTTSQQMFLQEVDLLGGFNVYKWITECFKKENFLAIW